VATILSPLGAYVSTRLNREVLLWMFVAFLLFAASMMLFYKPVQREQKVSRGREVTSGLSWVLSQDSWGDCSG
jgi:uncharacterized membrane protein YfcA